MQSEIEGANQLGTSEDSFFQALVSKESRVSVNDFADL